MLDPSAIRESHCPRNLDSLSHYLAGVAMRIALSTPDRLKDASIGTSDGVLTYTPLFESAPDDDSRVSFNNAASLFAGIYAEARFNTPGMLPPDDNDQLEVLINSDYSSTNHAVRMPAVHVIVPCHYHLSSLHRGLDFIARSAP